MQEFKSVKGLWLGTKEYKEALKIQERLYSFQQEPFFLGFQTPHPTITLGIRAKKSEEVLWLPDNFEVLKTDRGGQATLHSPGQLVIFPVLNLLNFNIGPKKLVDALLKSLHKPLSQKVGVALEMREDGLYTDLGKMAFVGVRIRHRKILHGLSLNVCNDTSEFSTIRSCGRERACHDSMRRYMKNPQPKQVFNMLFQAVERLDDARGLEVKLNSSHVRS